MQLAVYLGAVLSLAGFIKAATPPACILSAIGVQGSDATEMEVICDTNQKYVLGNITEACSSDTLEPAYDYYSKTCLDKASITVAPLSDETSGGSSGSDSAGSGSSGNDSGSDSGGDSGTDSAEGSSSDNNESAASRMHMAATGLLVTSLTGLLFV